MEYVRWQSESNSDAGDGATLRDHWEVAARRGNVDAIARLRQPELPESVEYLWGWLIELHGRSGVNMAGLNPLSYGTIEAWARLTGRQPDSLEVEALLMLDAAMLRPDTDRAVEPEAAPPRDDAWPEKKNG
jgi:hypothetical protein